MRRSLIIAASCAVLNMMPLDSAIAAETKDAQADICGQIRTKAKCEKEPACKVYEEGGKYYCVRNTREYPPPKLGYPLSN